MARSNLAPYAFVWINVKTMDFSGTIMEFVMKLVPVGHNDKRYLLTSKLCPSEGLFAPGLEIYTCIKPWKILLIITYQRDSFLNLHHLVIVTKGFI